MMDIKKRAEVLGLAVALAAEELKMPEAEAIKLGPRLAKAQDLWGHDREVFIRDYLGSLNTSNLKP